MGNDSARGDGAPGEVHRQTTHFGFQTVDLEDKQSLVDEVFHGVARRYDIMNDAMSGGLHRVWKDAMVAWLAPPRHGRRPYHVVDVAGGTGDIAMRIVARSRRTAQVTVCDINRSMLAVGARRAAQRNMSDRIFFEEGNAETLPYPDARFDAYTIAFGLRNVPRTEQALAEAFRVLKPGGRFLCLEFSQLDVAALEPLYEIYSHRVIPAIGRVIAGDDEPYRYLVESIRRFPNQARLKLMMGKAGFDRIEFRNLAGGVAAIHSGWKL